MRPSPDAGLTLNRETFLRQTIAGLGHLTEGVHGGDIAGSYVMHVGLSMGAAIEAEYKRFWGLDRAFTLDEYADMIIDLEDKVGGRFALMSKDAEKVVVRASVCPFDAYVRQSPALCFMTSAMLGGIAARNFGYAKVALHRRIALGDPACHVAIHLTRTAEARAAIGKEYLPDTERASPDIAEQLRLMERMRQLRRRLDEVNTDWEEVLRAAADAIWVLGPDGRILYANARWRDLLGVEGDELVGGDAERVVHPNDHRQARELRVRALRGERLARCELRLRHRSGEWRAVVVSAGPLRGVGGRPVAVLGIVHDITEENEAQQFKDDFLTTAAHELRTPVSTITMLTDLLLRSLKGRGPLDATQLARRVEQIQREADRMALLGTELMDASLLRAGRLATRRERLDLNEIAASCVERVRALIDADGAHSIVLLPARAPVPVVVERARVEQVLVTLLENAVKYSPGGGEISVSVSADTIGARVRVTDQGMGIPAGDLPKLFMPFYRASNATTVETHGLGLGLYLSRVTAEAHGGQLIASSTEGHGATFTLTLPLDAEELPLYPRKTVLVVDDDAGFQQTLEALLEMEGYEVVVARDGVEALEKLKEVTPAVILLDLMMPRMDGFEFVKEMERQGLRPAIPVIVLTADGRAEQKLEQIRPEGHMGKPFDVATLLRKVQQIARAPEQ